MAGAAVEQLRTRRRDDEQRHVGEPVDEFVDEVEQVVVRPVQVLEHEHCRSLLGEALDESPPRGEAFVASGIGCGQSDQRPQP